MSFYIFMRNKALFIPLEEVCVCTVRKRAPALGVPKAARGSQMGWSSPDKKGNILDQPLLRWVAALFYT